MDSVPDARTDVLSALQLTLVPGAGPRTQQLLLSRFGSAAGVLAASDEELRGVRGVGPKLLHSLREASDSSRADREKRLAEQSGITIALRSDATFPAGLRQLPDCPLLMYQRGEILQRDELAVAIVGSRNCTQYGRRLAERIASALARSGITIVSGLARGIDVAAHQGAINAGGRTIAVLGSGLLNLYPPEHEGLAGDVSATGAVVSEFPLEQRPAPGLFPQRNRLISGLSIAVVLIEARARSGALHTARHAIEQGRDVLAVPGRVDNSASDGCHELIRDGATLVRHVDDILESLGPLSAPVATSDHEEVHTPRELNLNEREREVLNLVRSTETPIEHILAATDLAPSAVLATLTVLEMKRLVRRLPGNHLIRTTG